VDAHGEVTGRATERVGRPVRPVQIAQALDAAARRVRRGPIRLAVVSAADPVDRGTGRLVHLPDAPFLVGDLSPVERLAEWVDGPVVVDNDVNWAARAEQAASGLDDFVYVHLGEGLGAAVVNDGEVRRGHSGFVGEIAHVLTLGPQRRAMPLTEVFAALGLRHAGSTAIDVDALLAAAEVRTTVARAVCGVLAAAVAFADPALVVIGGAWGPALVEAIATEFRQLPRHVPVRAARVTEQPALAGAGQHALRELRATINAVARSRSNPG